VSRQEFPRKVMLAAFERACGACESCGVRLTIAKFHYDHVLADGLGGAPTLENCQVLCWACHRIKTGSRDVPMIAKAERQRAKHLGANPRPRRSKWKRKVDGSVVLRNP